MNQALKPSAEDAAHFLIRQVHAHPHDVTIYAAGPLTNIALAISIDPHFAELAKGIVIMGGSLNPQTNDPEFVNNPRREFNFWFDPEATHITLRAHWARIDLTTVDISVKTAFTKAMLDQIAALVESCSEVPRNVHRRIFLLLGRVGGRGVARPRNHHEGEGAIHRRKSQSRPVLRRHPFMDR